MIYFVKCVMAGLKANCARHRLLHLCTPLSMIEFFYMLNKTISTFFSFSKTNRWIFEAGFSKVGFLWFETARSHWNKQIKYWCNHSMSISLSLSKWPCMCKLLLQIFQWIFGNVHTSKQWRRQNYPQIAISSVVSSEKNAIVEFKVMWRKRGERNNLAK